MTDKDPVSENGEVSELPFANSKASSHWDFLIGSKCAPPYTGTAMFYYRLDCIRYVFMKADKVVQQDFNQKECTVHLPLFKQGKAEIYIAGYR